MKYKLIILFVLLLIFVSLGSAHDDSIHDPYGHMPFLAYEHNESLNFWLDGDNDGYYRCDDSIIPFRYTGVDVDRTWMIVQLLDDAGNPVDDYDIIYNGTPGEWFGYVSHTYRYPAHEWFEWSYTFLSGDDLSDYTETVQFNVLRYADIGTYEASLYTNEFGNPIVQFRFVVSCAGTSPYAGQAIEDLPPGLVDEEGNLLYSDPSDEYSDTKTRWNAFFWADSFQACILILIGMIFGARMAGKVGTILALICGVILFTAIGWLPLYGVMLIFICIFVVLGIREVT